jgi:hypothetical protein
MRDQAELVSGSQTEAGARTMDIEHLLQWAIAQTGYLPWRGVDERDLEYNFGFNAIPSGARLDFRRGGPALRLAANDDVNAVIAAVKALEPRVAAAVIACARRQIRPECFVGREPLKVSRMVRQKTKKGKRKHRKRLSIMVWDIDPATVKLARQQYEAWHAALTRIAQRLDGQLKAFRVTLPEAPQCPWNCNPA